METPTPLPTTARSWKTVAREQRYTLRHLVPVTGRTYRSLIAYSCGERRIPQEVLSRLSEFFGEPVQ